MWIGWKIIDCPRQLYNTCLGEKEIMGDQKEGGHIIGGTQNRG